MNSYDYCNSCGRLFDYLDLKPFRMKWYCKACHKEMLRSYDSYEPSQIQNVFKSYDYCSRCGKIFDYLDLKPYRLEWYCERCYEEVSKVVAYANEKNE